MPTVLIQHIESAIKSGQIPVVATGLIQLLKSYGNMAIARKFSFQTVRDPVLLKALLAEWNTQLTQQVIIDQDLMIIARLLRRAGISADAVSLYDGVYTRCSVLPATAGAYCLSQEAAYNLAWHYSKTALADRTTEAVKAALADKIVQYLACLKGVSAFTGNRAIGFCYVNAANLYSDTGDLPKSVICYQEAVVYREKWEYYYDLALTLQSLGDYRQAQESLDKALKLIPDDESLTKAEIYYLQGEIAMQLYEPYRASGLFQEAVKLNNEMVYGYHNLFSVFRSLGDFRKSRENLHTAFNLYKKEWEENQFKDDVGKCYYYAELIGNSQCTLSLADFDRWEQLLIKYYKNDAADPDRADPDAAGELFKMYLAKKRAIEEGDLKPEMMAGEKAGWLEEVNAQVQEWYYKSIQQFNAALQKAKYENKRKELHTQLGRLYLSFEMYDNARENFLEALKLNPNEVETLEGAGVAYFKLGLYDEAISQFRKALQWYEGSLNIQCNLADSYRCKGSMEEAEMIYRKVLKVCPHYLDALIGLGECEKSSGDRSLEANDKAEAELYFQRAKDYFKKASEHRNGGNSSKLLTATEENALYYSCGYTRVRLYELGEGMNLPVLLGARNDLSKVKENSPEYWKAQKTIRLINKRMVQNPARKLASSLVFILAIALFLTTQILAFRNYKQEYTKVYELSGDAIRAAGKKAAKDSAVLVNKLTTLLLKQYTSLNQLEDNISKQLDPRLMAFIDMKTVEQKDVPKNAASSDIAFGSGTYGILTFSSLVFMVIGLFLPAITKIKVAGMEMEKVAVETVKASTQIITK